MSIQLDTNALYGDKPATGRLQQKARERMTLAAYNEARDNRTKSTIWAIVAFAHLMIVVYGFSMPGFTTELQAYPAAAIGLMIWVAGDLIYLAFYQKIHNHYQSTMDRLEGRSIKRR